MLLRKIGLPKKENIHSKWDFDKIASEYDEIVHRTGDWMYEDYDTILNKVIEYMCHITPNALVVEIGSGTGNLTLKILQKNVNVVCVEPSKEMRKILRRKCPQCGVCNGDFLNIPLKDKVADTVVSTFAFHHLTNNEKNESIKEMGRILKHKGKIIIADLMFQNEKEEKRIKQELRENGKENVVQEIEEEYYGMFEDLKSKFEKEGFMFTGERITKFVLIFAATKTCKER